MNTSTFSLTADADGMVATDCVKSARSPCSTLDVIRKQVISPNLLMSLQVLVNITLTYDIRENKIYEQCKGLIQYNFEQNNFQVTAPFRQSFSPLGCPTISTSNGAVLVDEEYFCTTGKKIKFQPEGYTSPIDVCGKRSFPLHGAFQLSMIGILNLGYWTEATSCRQHGFFTFTSLCIPTFLCILFVFLHSFVFSLYSYIPLYSNLS